MGSFKKFLGAVTVAGAAVGGFLYAKKRKEEYADVDLSDFEEDSSSGSAPAKSKVVDVNREVDEEGKTKVTITIDKDMAKEKAENIQNKIVDTLNDTIGEENIQTAKEKVSGAVSVAKDKVGNVIDKVVLNDDLEEYEDLIDDETEPDILDEAVSSRAETSKDPESIENSQAEETSDNEADGDKTDDEFLEEEASEI